MNSYNAAKKFVPILLATYFLIAVLGAWLSGKGEYFPFFSWSLFTHVSDERTLFEFEIVSIDAEMLPNPTRFYELGDRFPAAARKDPAVLKLAGGINAAISRGETQKVAELREVLERTYLTGYQQVRYRFVIGTYHPIERWRTRAVSSVRVVGEYEYRRTAP